MPKKPTKWGFKVIQMRFSVIGWGVKSHSWACSQVWALCCSKIGYLWSFEVYQGKRQAAAERDIGAAVVMRLTRHQVDENFALLILEVADGTAGSTRTRTRRAL